MNTWSCSASGPDTRLTDSRIEGKLTSFLQLRPRLTGAWDTLTSGQLLGNVVSLRKLTSGSWSGFAHYRCDSHWPLGFLWEVEGSQESSLREVPHILNSVSSFFSVWPCRSTSSFHSIFSALAFPFLWPAGDPFTTTPPSFEPWV